MKLCTVCPRSCTIDRTLHPGFCGETDRIRLALASIHKGEEPPLCGDSGSGTLFFSGCNLQCSFCQNWQISRKGLGKTISQEEFLEITLMLKDAGAVNINLVTASHYGAGLLPYLQFARNNGMDLPFLWNSSGYDKKEELEKLLPLVDIFLPDLKTVDTDFSSRILNTPDYGETAKQALMAVIGEKPLQFEGDLLKQGVFVRHLVMPGEIDSSLRVLRWYQENIGEKAFLSVMFQFTPLAGRTGRLPARCVSQEEYDTVMNELEKLEIEQGFAQERNEETDWVPDFTKPNPFPSSDSRIIWHWEQGFNPRP